MSLAKNILAKLLLAFLSLWVIVFHPATGQDLRLDSLKLALAHSQPDTNKVNLLVELSYLLRESDASYATEALKISKKLDFQEGIVNSSNSLGDHYRRAKNFSYSKSYYSTALEIANQINYKSGRAKSLMMLGKLYYTQSDFDSAEYYYRQSLPLLEKLGDNKNLSLNHFCWARLESLNENFKAAVEHYIRGITLSEQIGGRQENFGAYNNLASIFKNIHDYDKALKYYKKALDLLPNNSESTYFLHNNIGITYRETKDFDSALVYLKKVLIGADLSKDKYRFAYDAIGDVYMDQGHYQQAATYFLKSLDLNKKYAHRSESVAYTYNNLGKVYQQLDQEQVSLNYFKQALGIYEEEHKDKLSIGKLIRTRIDFGHALLKFTKYSAALRQGEIALSEAQLHQALSYQMEASLLLSKASEGLQDYKSANRYRTLYIASRDSLEKKADIVAIKNKETEFANRKKGALPPLLNNPTKKNNFLWLVSIGALMLILAFIFTKKLVLKEPPQVKTKKNNGLAPQDQKLFNEIDQVISSHLDDTGFTIKQLSKEVGLSHMHLYRKIKTLKGQSPSQYIRSHRLQQAAKLLAANYDNISQIAYNVGFNSISYFNKCFKDHFHRTPSEYKNYN